MNLCVSCSEWRSGRAHVSFIFGRSDIRGGHRDLGMELLLQKTANLKEDFGTGSVHCVQLTNLMEFMLRKRDMRHEWHVCCEQVFSRC